LVPKGLKDEGWEDEGNMVAKVTGVLSDLVESVANI